MLLNICRPKQLIVLLVRVPHVTFCSFKRSTLLVSSRSPAQSVSAGLLLLHGGDGGEAEPAEPHGDQSARLQAQHQPTIHLQTEARPLRQ